MNKAKTVIVTGAGGFLGANAVRSMEVNFANQKIKDIKIKLEMLY
jgi:hypothetical protein